VVQAAALVLVGLATMAEPPATQVRLDIAAVCLAMVGRWGAVRAG
jgi:hypothetical protein